MKILLQFEGETKDVNFKKTKLIRDIYSGFNE